jgi:purine nucleosidase
MKVDKDSIPVLRGSTSFLPGLDQPVRSEAVEDLIQRAMAMPEDEPLYVLAIGAITNIASALLLEPEITKKIVIVWLGGHAFHHKNTDEFNLKQDVLSARVVFDSGAPVVLIPCHGVTSHLHTTLPEMETYVKGHGAIGDYLTEIFKEYTADHFAYSKVIWDISAVAYMVKEISMQSELVHSPIVTDQVTWSFDNTRHFIRYVSSINRDVVFKDMFTKLREQH